MSGSLRGKGPGARDRGLPRPWGPQGGNSLSRTHGGNRAGPGGFQNAPCLSEPAGSHRGRRAVLARLPRRGVPMILREFREGMTKPFSFSGMQKIVHTMRDKIGLPSTFTLDACRHGGMTELEEAELTDGQGRALSAHKSQQAYEGYAKRTMGRALSATRKRHAHRLANAAGTNIQNEPRNDIQNDETAKNKIGAK
jgi:hypothetical protein